MITTSPCGKYCPDRTPVCKLKDESGKPRCKKWAAFELEKLESYKTRMERVDVVNYQWDVTTKKQKNTLRIRRTKQT